MQSYSFGMKNLLMIVGHFLKKVRRITNTGDKKERSANEHA